jgi:hypothetical protein
MGWAMLPAMEEAEVVVSVTVVERMGAARRVIPIYRPPVAHRSVADDRPVSLALPCHRFSSTQSTSRYLVPHGRGAMTLRFTYERLKTAAVNSKPRQPSTIEEGGCFVSRLFPFRLPYPKKLLSCRVLGYVAILLEDG